MKQNCMFDKFVWGWFLQAYVHLMYVINTIITLYVNGYLWETYTEPKAMRERERAKECKVLQIT